MYINIKKSIKNKNKTTENVFEEHRQAVNEQYNERLASYMYISLCIHFTMCYTEHKSACDENKLSISQLQTSPSIYKLEWKRY